MKLNKLLSLLLVIALAVSLLPAAAWADPSVDVGTNDPGGDPVVVGAETAPADIATVVAEAGADPRWDGAPVFVETVPPPLLGSGTYENPYVLYCYDSFFEVSKATREGQSYGGCYFVLAGDVDLSGKALEPIGPDDDHPFAGQLDGCGYQITGLTIGGEGLDTQGLFGSLTGTVKNLTVEGAVRGHNDVGGIAARNLGMIDSCVFAGEVSGDHSVGGVAGRSAGTIKNCILTGKVDGAGDYTGGITGIAVGGTVADCRSAGEVNGVDYIGGIVGNLLYGTTFTGCVNEGNVTSSGTKMVGGVVGLSSVALDGCVNTGNIGTGFFSLELHNAGGIVGQALSDVSNCRNSGSIRCYGNHIGGIAGFAKKGVTVSGCVNTGEIYVGMGEYAGGIVGDNYATIIRCDNYGTVRINNGSVSGGVAGDNDGGTITDCFNSGWVFAGGSYDQVGGIVGWHTGGTVSYCVNAGPVTTYDQRAGGLVGDLCYGGVLAYSINSGDVCGNRYSGGIAGFVSTGAVIRYCGTGGDVKRNSSPMKYSGSLVGELWEAELHDCYTHGTFEGGAPLLLIGENDDGTAKNLYTPTGFSIGSFSDSYWYTRDGIRYLRGMTAGAVNGVLTISNAQELAHFRNMVNGGMDYRGVTVRLTADIDLGGQEWTPIGWRGEHDDVIFIGTFDGGGHTVFGLSVDVEGGCAGLFGRVEGEIKNLNVRGTVCGGEDTGGIVGDLRKDAMENCSFSGTVSGGLHTGGLIGYAEKLNVVNCSADAYVTGGKDTGGLVGFLETSGTIERCAVYGGTVKGGENVGGIVGKLEDSTAVVNCLHIGVVSGEIDTGGVVGALCGSSKAQYCCHFTGKVNSTKPGVNGVVPYVEKNASTKKCYYLSGTVYLNNQSDGNSTKYASPLSAVEFALQNSFSDWNFSSVWSMAGDHPVPRTQLCSISFDANGGSGSMASGSYAALPHCSFAREGYDFRCWASAPDGSGEVFADGASVAGRGQLKLYAIWAKKASVTYVDAIGAAQGPQEAWRLSPQLLTLRDGWYYTEGIVICAGRIEIAGDINLILKDGSALVALGGIHVPVGRELTIWGQQSKYTVPGVLASTQGTGQLVAMNYARFGGSHNAAIGGDNGEGSGTITVNGGIIRATAMTAAAIGGGANAGSGSITLNNGYINAQSGNGAAAIGGGFRGTGGAVALGRGTVVAHTGSGGQAIGSGGNVGEPGALTLNGNLWVYDSATAAQPVAAAQQEAACRGAYVCVIPAKSAQTLAFEGSSVVEKTYADEDFAKAAVLATGNGAVSYASDNTRVAMVDGTGKVHITGVGTAVITATAAETATYTKATASYTLTVCKATWTNKTIEIQARSGETGTVDLCAFLAPGGTLGELSVRSGFDLVYNVSADTEAKLLGFAVKNVPVTADESNAYVDIPVAETAYYMPYGIEVHFTLTNKQPQALTFARTAEKTYGDGDFSLAATLTEGNGAISYTSNAPNVAMVDGSGNVTIKGTGVAVITATAAETEVYAKATASCALTVSGKVVTVMADAKNKAAGSSDPVLTATVTGPVGSDTVQYTLTREAGENAGTYAITPSGNEEQGNYIVTFVPGTLTITARETSDAPVINPDEPNHEEDDQEKKTGVTDAPEQPGPEPEPQPEPQPQPGHDPNPAPTTPEEVRFDVVEPTKGGSMDGFKPADVYVEDTFSDVSVGAWYEENIRAAVNLGLMLGRGKDFGVGDDLKVSEALALACRLHNIYYGGSGVFDQTKDDNWYDVYADYAERYGFIDSGINPEAPITRAQFAAIISAALPDEALTPINDVTEIPDVASDDPNYAAILRLYRAGILTGVDARGDFLPDAPITREQIAAVVTRVADPTLRKSVTI